MYKDTIRIFLKATWRYKWLLIVAQLGFMGFILAIDIGSPYLVSQAIDKLTKSNVATLHFSDFSYYILIFALLQLGYIVFGRINVQAFIRYSSRAVRDLEDLSFKKLIDHSMAFFADNFSGALVAKVNRFTAAYQRFIETVFVDVFNFVFRYVVTMAVLFVVSPVIASAFLAWTILFCTSLFYLHRNKLKYSKAVASAQTRVTARLADMITNTLTIHSFARGKNEEGAFHEITEEKRELKFRSEVISDYIRLYKSVVISGLDVLILTLSIHYALAGALSVGQVVLIQFYVMYLVMQLWDFGRFMDRIEEGLADSSEMTDILMQAHDIVDVEHPEKCTIQAGRIQFEGVHFQYPDANQQNGLFTDLNVTIEAGQKVGLVGPSGGGKTTLTKLLLRFMDIQSGTISIDGQNIANIAQDDLRSSIAYVPQEPLLFHRTIQENIAYGRPDASQEDVEDAAVKAHAAEFINVLPKKYNTIVGERGVKLSGGQRQRVAIARAMLKHAPIIVLDEATSSLDSISERLITDALDKLMEKRTTVVIAHRLSTIRKLDRILVLSDGKIIEDGSHDQLLEKGGAYATLWAHQSGDFLEED
jgi:ATP-binding cassette subfamily B protein